ncbi:hypothetical protein Gotur_003467 [Gossypium turneri]
MLLPCNWLIALLLVSVHDRELSGRIEWFRSHCHSEGHHNKMVASLDKSILYNPEPLVEFDTVANQKKQHEVNVDDEAKAQSGERSKHYAKIGWSKNQETAKTNPKLAVMNKKFGMIHGLSSLARIFKLFCLLLYIGLNVGCIHFD